MNIQPILSALRRHRTATILIMVEIALSCAILCNAIFMVANRESWTHLPSGLAEDQTSLIQISGWGADGDDAAAVVAEHLAALRAIAGVQSVAAVSAIPFGNDNWQFGASLHAQDKEPVATISEYLGGEQALQTLGLQLLEGRDFTPDEYAEIKAYLSTSPAVIVTRSLAEKLWPGQPALGQTFYLSPERQYRVVGVVAHLARADIRDGNSVDFAALFPAIPGSDLAGSYLLRTKPDARGRVLKEAADALLKVSPTAIVRTQKTYAEIRAGYFQPDRVMVHLLLGVCVLLLTVTAFGIAGLASFWVQGRTRQIGIRRALGARRSDILRYFQTENFLIVSGGIMLGMLCAYSLSLGLMNWYELPRLPFVYLPIGAVALWLLGQLAVLGPALRAARVPPAVATRGG